MKTTITARKPSQREAYFSHMSKVKALIAKLNKKLDEHQQQMAADPRNWGFSGDLDTVEEQLKTMHLMDDGI